MWQSCFVPRSGRLFLWVSFARWRLTRPSNPFYNLSRPQTGVVSGRIVTRLLLPVNLLLDRSFPIFSNVLMGDLIPKGKHQSLRQCAASISAQSQDASQLAQQSFLEFLPVPLFDLLKLIYINGSTE